MSTPRTTTLDTIHQTLERLGYVGVDFGATRMAGMYGVYRQLAGESVVVGWAGGATVYELFASSLAVAHAVVGELARTGLTCRPEANRIYVHGQEHIDAEVRKMLAL